MAYDIFISYRRKDSAGLTSGTNIARTIKQQLEIEGYKNRVFFDYSELNDDEFKSTILSAIEQCKVFVLVLSRDSMMRCVNEDDWVRREICQAQKCGLKIIPIEPDNLFNGYPDKFPVELDVIKRIQHTTIHMDSSFERDMRAMIESRIVPTLSRQSSDTAVMKGALVRVYSDLECCVLDFGKQIARVCEGISEIRLSKGKHKLAFVEVVEERERYECLLDIKDLEYEDYIEVKLLDKYNTRKATELAEQKAKEEAERKAREEAACCAKEEEERKAREEAARCAKEEEERKARAEAARRVKEEEERKAREEAARCAKEEEERKARAEAARRAKEEAERKAREEAARRVKEEAERRTDQVYKIGDIVTVNGVKSGVVFQTFPQVKIVSVAEKKRRAWGEVGVITDARDENDGAKNMEKIKSISGWESKYPAFKWCTFLGEDWYLPALNELNAIYNQKDVINKTLLANGFDEFSRYEHYRSSTERNSGSAYVVNLSSGDVNDYSKNSRELIRAVLALDDTTTVPISSGKTYKVGDYYNENGKEGVVFEVTPDGKHGKIVSMMQSVEKLQWSSDEIEQKRLIGADGETDGAYNMAKVKAIEGWESKYPAFKWCADLGDGWYLPAIDELQKFLLDVARHHEVNRTLMAKGGTKLHNRSEYAMYWSSTEESGNQLCAWSVEMYFDDTCSRRKSISNYVRAVSAF